MDGERFLADAKSPIRTDQELAAVLEVFDECAVDNASDESVKELPPVLVVLSEQIVGYIQARLRTRARGDLSGIFRSVQL